LYTVKLNRKSKAKDIRLLLILMFCLGISSLLGSTVMIKNSDITADDIEENNNQGLSTEIEQYPDGYTAEQDSFLHRYTGPKDDEYYYPPTKTGIPIASYSGYYDNLPLATITRVIVILVTFSDVLPTLSAGQLNAQVFGNFNSLKSYIQEVSNGKCTIQGSSTAWLPLGQTEEYYGRNSTTGIDDYYGPSNRLFNDSIDRANPTVDFNLFDKIIIYHSGNGESQGLSPNDFWSSSYMPSDTPLWVRDGANIYSASVVAEAESLGVLFHEFGHQCGLPELSDTTASGLNYLDDWCLMDTGYMNNGGSTPAHMTAYCKLFLDLIPSEQIKTVHDGDINYLHFDSFSTGGPNYLVAKLPLFNENEYYLVEFRRLQNFDANLPDRGVIITFVNESKTSGHGIVNLVDAVPSTLTKNDGQFDVSNETLNRNSIWNDIANGIQIIVAGESNENITVWINRGSISSYAMHNVGFLGKDTFSIGALVLGQEVSWHWYTDDPDRQLDFYVENTGNSVRFEEINNMQYDAGVWKCTQAGNYQLALKNDNIQGCDYWIIYGTTTAPNVNFDSIDNSPVTKYVVRPFTINTTISNNDESTDETINLSLSLPSGIQLASGETNERLISNLGYLDNYTTSWNLSASSTGLFNVELKINSNWHSEVTQIEPISISVDSVDPSLSITDPINGIWTKLNNIQITWDGSDDQSGIKEYRIYKNEVYISTKTATTSTYTVGGLVTGSQTIKVSAIDNSNRITNETITVNRDSTNPIINEFSTALEWITDNSMIEFHVDCQDAGIGLGEYRIYKSLTGSVWSEIHQAALSGALSEFDITVDVGSTGSATTVYLKLSVTDDIGNMLNSSSLITHVDRIAPQLLGFEPLITWMIQGDIPEFEVNCTDAGSGLNKLRLYRQTTPGTWIQVRELILTPGVSNYIFDADLGQVANPSVKVKVQVYDVFNNSINSTALSVGVDDRAPYLVTYSLSDATPSNTKYSGNVHFKFTASDYGSGIDQILYDIANGTIHTTGSLIPASPFRYELIYNSYGDGGGALEYTININITMYDNVGNSSTIILNYNINNIGYDPSIENPTPPPDPLIIGVVIGVVSFGLLGTAFVVKNRSSSTRVADGLYEKSKVEKKVDKKTEKEPKKKAFSKDLKDIEFVSENPSDSSAIKVKAIEELSQPSEDPQIKVETSSSQEEMKSDTPITDNKLDEELFADSTIDPLKSKKTTKSKEIKDEDLFKF
jgi:M6 family metalloprotease-like protein